jgi:alkanesulfonate monooxygenase SsuD/methylene tetrahydromethanopterin reductase-like flavin-dependent oxidoreductase (luciferase family)
MLPGCVQSPRVPLTIAAAGPRALALAAAIGDGWVTYGPVAAASGEEWFAAVAAQVDHLDAACAAMGRAPGTIRRTCLIGLDDRWQAASPEFGARVAAMGFDEIAFHWRRPDGRGASAVEIETLVSWSGP